MIRYIDDNKPFIIPNNIESARKKCELNNQINMYNHFTNEAKKFHKMNDVCQFLSIKPSTLTARLKNRNPIFNSGWEVKYGDDNTPWKKLTNKELLCIKSGGLNYRPICVTNINTNESFYFKNSSAAVKYYNILPTTLNYRLTVNKKAPSKDGFIYRYLDEIKIDINMLTSNEVS